MKKILVLILMALAIVGASRHFNSSPIPQFTEEQNKQIMLEEFIPPYNLEPIKE